MKKEKWFWMGHAGLLRVSDSCRFHLNTYVGKYIVSTVGEYVPSYKLPDVGRKIGLNRLYETMVFKACKTKDSTIKCCPYEVLDYMDIDFAGYNTAEEAQKGHLRLCQKWSVK